MALVVSEWTLVWYVALKLFLLSFFCLAYVVGGRSQKWVRRYVGGIGFAAGLISLSVLMGKFQWPSLALLGLYPLGLSLNYGADVLWKKVALRAVYGLYFGLLGLFCGWLWGVLYLGIVQVFIAVAASVFLGVFNPVRAVDEEAMIALALVIHIPFML